MPSVVFDVKGIEVVDFKPREGAGSLIIHYTKNGQAESIKKDFEFKDPFSMFQSIITEIKKKGNIVVEDESDILSGYYVVRFENEEELEAKLLDALKRLVERVKMLKSTKNATVYMRLFNEIKVLKYNI